MKNKSYIILVFLVLLIISSCKENEDFLDRPPLGNLSDANVFSNVDVAVGIVNSSYRNIWAYPFSFVVTGDYVDEGHSTYRSDVLLSFNNCNYTENGITGWYNEGDMSNTRRYNWNELYQVVRQTNILLSNIDNVPVSGESQIYLKRRIKGEAYFIRGLAYHFLTSLYGGVPIVEQVFNPGITIEIPRNSYEDCINFIVAQLDSAANILPLEWNGTNSANNSTNVGRATKGAAMALKARVLLYAASDLHHTMSAYAPGFAHPELLGYTGGDRTARWTAAKNAAKAVMDLGMYDLYKAIPATGDSVAKNISDYFLTKDMTVEDILYQRYSSNSTEDWDAGQANQVWPGGGWDGWGITCPIGDLVDDYEMKDGSRFDWNNPTLAANPYSNRDARLYATVLYEGATWRPRPSNYTTKDPFGKYQFGIIEETSGTFKFAGLDNRRGNASSANNCTFTGYNMRKFIDPTFSTTAPPNQWIPFRHFRYAEVLLNYAEACIGLNQENEARTYINKVRVRAGQPELDASVTGAALLARYRNERRIELAFENHRFFDVRRWVIGPDAYHATHGAKVVYKVSDGTAVTNYFKDPATGEKWSVPAFSSIVFETRSWNNKGYFFPIMRTELGRNTKLLQNPGYGGL